MSPVRPETPITQENAAVRPSSSPARPVSAELGVSRQRVSDIAKSALNRMERQLRIAPRAA